MLYYSFETELPDVDIGHDTSNSINQHLCKTSSHCYYSFLPTFRKLMFNVYKGIDVTLSPKSSDLVAQKTLKRYKSFLTVESFAYLSDTEDLLDILSGKEVNLKWLLLCV